MRVCAGVCGWNDLKIGHFCRYGDKFIWHELLRIILLPFWYSSNALKRSEVNKLKEKEQRVHVYESVRVCAGVCDRARIFLWFPRIENRVRAICKRARRIRVDRAPKSLFSLHRAFHCITVSHRFSSERNASRNLKTKMCDRCRCAIAAENVDLCGWLRQIYRECDSRDSRSSWSGDHTWISGELHG